MSATPKKKEPKAAIRFERRLAHAPEKVWRAITEESELRQWFPATVEGERGVGAELRFVERDGDGAPGTGRITEYEPPRVLAYTWGDETLRWELSPIPGGCLLVFTAEGGERSRAWRSANDLRACLSRVGTRLSRSASSKLRTIREAA